MVSQVLQVIIESREPVSLPALSRKLNIEPGALEGILEFWVRKGRLHEDGQEAASGCRGEVINCGPSCAGAAGCAFMAKMPKVYSHTAETDLRRTAGRNSQDESGK